MSVILKQLNEQMTNDDPFFSSYINFTYQFVIYLTQEIVPVTSTSTKLITTLATIFFGFILSNFQF